jgi:hypothetical protein
MKDLRYFQINTGYFTSDNEPGRVENVTHNTSGRKAMSRFTFQCIVGCIFYSTGPIITREIPYIYRVFSKLKRSF